jgi:hypothetical protein
MKHKKLLGFKLNQVVYIVSENRYDRIVYIDDHAHGNFCMSMGGRFFIKDLRL